MAFDGWTLALEAINFIVLVALLHRLLYRPVLAAVDARQRAIVEETTAIGEQRAAADGLRDEYRASLNSLEEERIAGLERDRAALDVERREILDRSRAEADELRRAVRAELGRERDDAFDQVRAHAAELAVDIAARLLREARFASATAPFLERAIEYLAAMPADERDRLLGEDEPPSVRVVTAPMLQPAQQTRWRELLTDLLGSISISFEADDELIAGCELRFASGIVRYAWGPVLDQARAELTRHVDAA